MINMKLLLTLICGLSLSATLACKSAGPRKLSMAIDSNSSSRFYYNGQKTFKDKPEVTVDNCQNTAKSEKYLMIAVALENFVLSNETGNYSYNDLLSARGDNCRIENNPFENQEPVERTDKLFERRELFNHCITMQVTDFSNGGITYPKEQVGCEITAVSKNSVNMKGAFCYFKPGLESVYSVHFEVDDKCYNKNYLATNNIALQDINAILATYIAGDASGRSSDLVALSNTELRLSLNPLDSILNVSESFGEDRPTWPSTWTVGNVELGNVELQDSYSDLTDYLNIPFIVDNRCERTCNRQGLCSSPCDYSQPVVGRFNLFEYDGKKRKFEYLRTWYDGSVAPAQYQGFLYGAGIEFEKSLLQVGKRYKIEVEFDEPDLAFAQFDGRIRELLRLRANQIPAFNRDGGYINEIPAFEMLNPSDKIPTLKPIREGVEFNSVGLSRYMKESLNQLENYFDNSYWPPYFEKVCDAITGRCKKMGDGQVTLTMTFSIGLNDGYYEAQNIKISRNGNLGRRYKNVSQPTYKINCRRERR